MSPAADPAAVPVTPAEWLVWGATLAASALVVAAIRRAEAGGGEAVPGRAWPRAEWSGTDVLFLCGTMILAVATCVAPFDAGAPPAVRMAAGAGGLLLGTLAIVAVLRVRGSSWESIGLSGFDPGGDLRLALAGLFLVTGPLLLVSSALDRLVRYEHPVIDTLAAGRSPFDVAAVVLAAVIAAPIAEELLFRRVILGWFDARFPSPGGVVAILASALAFGLAHLGQGLAWIPLVILGVALGELARRRGSLLPAILLHGLFNGVSVVLLLLQPAAAG